MSELFDIEESLSPRLAWMREHGVTTLEIRGNDGDVSFWEASSANKQFCKASGSTEDEAIGRFATRNHLKLWNEKQPRP